MRLYDRVFLEVLKTWLRNLSILTNFVLISKSCRDFWALDLIKNFVFFVFSGCHLRMTCNSTESSTKVDVSWKFLIRNFHFWHENWQKVWFWQNCQFWQISVRIHQGLRLYQNGEIWYFECFWGCVDLRWLGCSCFQYIKLTVLIRNVSFGDSVKIDHFDQN